MWLIELLVIECAWLVEYDQCFCELIIALHDDVESEIFFFVWVMTWLRDRRCSFDDEVEVLWEVF